MREIYLDVTYQGGLPLGAYLYLPRQDGDRSVRAEQHPAGLIADLTADGRPIGIEIGFPSLVTIEAVNEALVAYGLEPIDAVELAPLLEVA